MSQRTSELSRDLLKAVEEEGAKLAVLSEEEGNGRAGVGPGWSRKEELGHLVDSATNNRARFVGAALAASYSGSTYDGDGWVNLGGYRSMAWNDLIALWTAQNNSLAALISNIPDEKLEIQCRIGESEVTLGFLIEDYILHLQHHLDHLLGREASTSYPGAAMGV